MLIIGNNNLVNTSHLGEGHWIFQVADHYKETPKVLTTESVEETYQQFIKLQKHEENIIITIPDLVHQKIGNFVYSWDNEEYLDINHTRRRDMLLMTHTPDTMVNHNLTYINSIKLIRKDAKIVTEWAQISPCVAEELTGATTTPYYSKKALSDQFIRWCNIHNADISKHTELDKLVNACGYYNSDYTYNQEGNNKIFGLITAKNG
jgi:hypothetical protein